jgi:hypothetical protein
MALQEHDTWVGELGIWTWPRESVGALQMVIKANSRGFYGRMAWELGQVDTWVGKLGIQTWPRESILDICPTR